MTLLALDDDLDREWQDLAFRTGAPPFLHPGWFRAWHAAFGRGELLAAVERRGGELVGVLPLRREGSLVASPTNWHSPAFGPVAVDHLAASALYASVAAMPARRIDLGHLEPAGRTAFETSADAVKRRTTGWVQQESPYIRTDGAVEAFLAERDPRWLRQLDRRRERLARTGQVTLEVVESTSSLESLLDEAFRLEASGWKGRAGTAILSSPATHRFYREIARWAQPQGFLRLAALRRDGRLIAFDFALEHGGVHYFMKTGYDETLSANAPGLILRRDMIVRAFECGLQSYELLGGAEDYKRAWTTTSRKRHRVMAFGTSLAAAVDFAAQAYGRPAIKAIRRWRHARTGAARAHAEATR